MTTEEAQNTLSDHFRSIISEMDKVKELLLTGKYDNEKELPCIRRRDEYQFPSIIYPLQDAESVIFDRIVSFHFALVLTTPTRECITKFQYKELKELFTRDSFAVTNEQRAEIMEIYEIDPGTVDQIFESMNNMLHHAQESITCFEENFPENMNYLLDTGINTEAVNLSTGSKRGRKKKAK